MSDDNISSSQPLVEFLRLESSARAASSVSDLGFVIVNETYRLIQYRQAFFCRSASTGLSLETISGLAGVDRHSPFYDWFAQLAAHIDSLAISQQPIAISCADVPERIQGEWYDWLPDHLLVVPLSGSAGAFSRVIATLILVREEPFREDEQQTLSLLAQAYGHALSALAGPDHFYDRFISLLTGRKIKIAIAIFLVAVLFMPVRQSSLGPAEVTPLVYNLISAPLDGVIATVQVKPNERVRTGQVLFRLDDTTIRNRLESAHRTMGVAKSEEFLSRQKSFTDPQSRGDVATQEARVKEKGSTISYMRELLGKMEVKAPSDGIVLFGDPSDWEGRPVTTGERVMTLADERSAGITIWLPSSDAVSLEAGRRVRLFLNSDPLKPLEAVVLRAAYQPVLSPEGVASYRVTADFAAGSTRPRLGLKGTAKVYGERVSLGYYLFRRPIAALRQLLGW